MFPRQARGQVLQVEGKALFFHCVFIEHLLCTKHYSRLDLIGACMLMEIDNPK